jgi:CBS domain containing-hemolysin-like protein/mannitol/fructose-specific phosphotransferase system IIA component
MDWTTPLYMLLALFLVLLNGFFVLAEFAIVKVRASRIEELVRQGNRRALAAQSMVAGLDNYLSATQLGITVASLGLGWVGEPAFASVVESVVGRPDWLTDTVSHTLSVSIAFILITFLHILIGELAPKSIAIRRAEQCTLLVAYPMRVAYWIFYLPMLVLNGASNLILRAIGLRTEQFEVTHTEQELRMLLSTAQVSGRFSLNRLLLLENILDLGTLTVKEAMIPWSQVRWLPRIATIDEVRLVLTEHRFSRYPVVDRLGGTPVGYLLMKDLIVHQDAEADWRRLIRPLRSVGPNDNLETTMQQLQRDGANMATVVDRGQLVGLITLEDVLEEVVGRIEDEYPRLPRVFLKDALAAGGMVLDLVATTPEDAIRELAAVVPLKNLPPGVDVCRLALDRERQMPTDIGNRVAIPHARCPGLDRSMIVMGRSREGIVFSEKAAEPVRLVFLLITPAERPQLQVFFLAQLASIAESEFVLERLYRARTPQEVIDTIAAADPAVTG